MGRHFFWRLIDIDRPVDLSTAMVVLGDVEDYRFTKDPPPWLLLSSSSDILTGLKFDGVSPVVLGFSSVTISAPLAFLLGYRR